MHTLNKTLLSLVLLATLAACGKQDAPSAASGDTPHGAVMVAVEALRANDVEALLRGTLSDSEYQEARAEWDAARAGELDPAEAARLNAMLTRLHGDEAVDEIMAEITPRLDEVRSSLPLMLGLAQTVGHASIANSEHLSADQKASANELLGALGRWAGGRDLADPALAKEAVELAVNAGRSLELKQAEEIRALEFEAMAARAGTLLAAGKAMLGVYGFSVDEMLDSVSAETLSQEQDQAVVRIAFRFLGTDQKVDVPMIRRDGRWYGENAERRFPTADPEDEPEA